MQLNYPSVSRQHAALCRGEDEDWTLYDLGSKGGTAVNGEPVEGSAPVKLGDTITLGGVPLIFLPQTVAEREELEARRLAERPGRHVALLSVADGVPGPGLSAADRSPAGRRPPPPFRWPSWG